MDYEGERDLAGFLAFFEKHATHKFVKDDL